MFVLQWLKNSSVPYVSIAQYQVGDEIVSRSLTRGAWKALRTILSKMSVPTIFHFTDISLEDFQAVACKMFAAVFCSCLLIFFKQPQPFSCVFFFMGLWVGERLSRWFPPSFDMMESCIQQTPPVLIERCEDA